MTERADHLAIVDLIAPGARVLDVGCDRGDLLALLQERRGVTARGLEISADRVADAVARGLSVVQGNADTDLAMYPDRSLDVAVLSKTLQEMRDPSKVLADLRRIAPHVIISFSNYGHWRHRATTALTGRSPAPRGRPWHASQSLHPCTFADVHDLARSQGVAVRSVTGLNGGKARQLTVGNSVRGWTGAFCEDIVMLLDDGA